MGDVKGVSISCAKGWHLNCLGRVSPLDYPPTCVCFCHGKSNIASHGKNVPNIGEGRRNDRT